MKPLRDPLFVQRMHALTTACLNHEQSNGAQSPGIMQYSEYVSLLHQYAEKAQEHMSSQEQDKSIFCESEAASVTDVLEVPSLPIHWVASTGQGSSAPQQSILNGTQLTVGLFDAIVYTS